jgi:DNA-binding NtrC family response regulator
MVTGYASLEGAVEAVKAGAADYLSKPFTEDELSRIVEAAGERIARRRAGHGALEDTGSGLHGLLGSSAPMQTLRRDIARAASSNATVLIVGESGTGKELVARAVHYASARAGGPFLPVHCGGIPDTLLESELFGHVKGAFTGASESRAGYFQAAHTGTLFLDEIGDVSPAMQVRLLRVLQEREIAMVGSPKPIPIDVRIVAATNKDLSRAVEQGRFREDLYFRLHVLVLEVPPLRSRGDDILSLAHHLAARFATDVGRDIPAFSDAALDLLQRYSWPGNVRELENVVQRAVVMSDATRIDVPQLPPGMRFSLQTTPDVQRTLADVEREHVRRVLEATNGNKSAAARILGIDRKTLREKLRDAD